MFIQFRNIYGLKSTSPRPILIILLRITA